MSDGRVADGHCALAAKAGYEIRGYGVLKSAPRGYSTDHPRIGLLRNKVETDTWQLSASGAGQRRYDGTVQLWDPVIERFEDGCPAIALMIRMIPTGRTGTPRRPPWPK